jgi:hypothetical protein
MRGSGGSLTTILDLTKGLFIPTRSPRSYSERESHKTIETLYSKSFEIGVSNAKSLKLKSVSDHMVSGFVLLSANLAQPASSMPRQTVRRVRICAARLGLAGLLGFPSMASCDQIYRNALWRYEVSFPDSWTKDTEDSERPDGVTYQSWFDAPPDMNLRTCNTHASISESTVTMSQEHVNAKLIESKDDLRALVEKQSGRVFETFIWDIGRAKAVGFVNESSIRASGRKIQLTAISINFFRPGISYNVTCGAPKGFFFAARPTFEGVLRSVRLP